MNETIASRCLAVAKQNEEKRVKEIQDRILNIVIRPMCNKFLQDLKSFPENEAIPLEYNWSALGQELGTNSEEDTERCFKSLGFKLFQQTSKRTDSEPIYISVLSQEDGATQTIAQMLVEKSEHDLREEISRQETLATAFWKDIEETLEKNLKAKKLDTFKLSGNKFEIQLIIAVPRLEEAQSYNAYQDKLIKLVTENGFNSISVYSDNEVCLQVSDHTDETAKEPKPAEADEAESAD